MKRRMRPSRRFRGRPDVRRRRRPIERGRVARRRAWLSPFFPAPFVIIEFSMTLSEIKTVGVLGGGTMGNGIAHVFARSGYNVVLRDVEQRFVDRALEAIGKNLDREVKKG